MFLSWYFRLLFFFNKVILARRFFSVFQRVYCLLPGILLWYTWSYFEGYVQIFLNISSEEEKKYFSSNIWSIKNLSSQYIVISYVLRCSGLLWIRCYILPECPQNFPWNYPQKNIFAPCCSKLETDNEIFWVFESALQLKQFLAASFFNKLKSKKTHDEKAYEFKIWDKHTEKKIFSNFSCMFLNPNIFFQFEF